MKAKSVQMLGMVLIVFLVMIGCAGKKQVQSAPEDPSALYKQGMVLFNGGKYEEAIEVFTRLKDYFPTDELYAPKADLRIADCYFFRKEYPEAITRYLEFKKQYPFHPDIPYVDYQVGLCHYRQMLSKDRDQKATEQAMAAFQNVVANYPDTILAHKAREKITFCRRRLAEHELYVAHFYLRKDEYAAAEKRAYTALEKYSACGVDDQALYYLALALHKQEKDAAALTPLQLLVGDHPQSPFAKQGKKLLASLKEQGVIAASPTGEEIGMREARPTLKEEMALPFRITAKHTQNIVETNSILYTDDVVALGEGIRIRAESLLLTKDANNVPIEMVARDEVVVARGEDEIFGKKAVWSPTQQTIVVTVDAKIKRGMVWKRADAITLHVDTGRIEVAGEQKMEGPGMERIEELEQP